jgi:two-component system chemotaxis response regulator CheY
LKTTQEEGGTVRFLIVDDDHSCRDLLKKIVSPYGRCDLAFDGGEAISLFRQAFEEEQPYQLIFLDVIMPGLTGWETLDCIRQIERSCKDHGGDPVKVIVITTFDDPKSFAREFANDGALYLRKPFQPQHILEKMRELFGELKRPESSEETAAADGDNSFTGDNKPAMTTTAKDNARHHYLLVDDDAVCRSKMADFLSPYGECHFAYNGLEAVEAFRQSLENNHPYDLITLDLMMPGMGGHDTLQIIRALEARNGLGGSKGIKVVVATSIRESKHCIQAFREGCECYITKPIQEKELLEKLVELGILKVATVYCTGT